MQAQLAKAMQCQATYLIRVLKGTANLTEDQAYRCGRFLQLTNQELDYFLDLVRMDRAADLEVKKYFQENLEKKSRATREVKSRVDATSIEASLSSQIQYYSSWTPSVLHLATSCPHLQTVEALSRKFLLSEEKVREILSFLNENGLVHHEVGGGFTHNGKSLHLAKGSPLHTSFQKVRREIVLRHLGEKGTETDLHFSSAFATSKQHLSNLKGELLKLIETSHKDLGNTVSEEIALLVVDFLQLS